MNTKSTHFRFRINALTTAVIMFFAVALFGVITQASADTSNSRYDAIVKRDKLIAVTMTTIPPFAFKDEKGNLVGFDIDIYKLVARELLGDKEKIEFVGVGSAGRWPAILTGQADLGIGTIYMRRANNVAFTYPVMDTSINLLVTKKSGITSLADVNKPGITVANLENPQMKDRANRFFPKAKTIILDGSAAQLLAIKSGRAQAMQMDTAVNDYYAALNKGELISLGAMLGDMFGNGIYCQPGDFKWIRWLDTFVQELRFGSLYADYREIYNKWYGKNPPPQRHYLENN